MGPFINSTAASINVLFLAHTQQIRLLSEYHPYGTHVDILCQNAGVHFVADSDHNVKHLRTHRQLQIFVNIKGCGRYSNLCAVCCQY
jgi:hypothetical protein